MLQWRAAGGQLLYVWVTDGAVGGEEEFAQAGQAAGEVLETPGAALQRGTPAQVQLLQHPDQPQTIKESTAVTPSTNSDGHRKQMHCAVALCSYKTEEFLFWMC